MDNIDPVPDNVTSIVPIVPDPAPIKHVRKKPVRLSIKDIKLYNRQKTEELKESIVKATSKKDILDVWNKVIEQAKRGQFQQQKLFLEYIVGAPKQTIEATVHNLSPEEINIKIDQILNLNPNV